jgi:hypothetical protein
MLHKEHQRVRGLAVGTTSASYEFVVAPSAEPTTISDRVLLTIAFSLACSLAGTLNLSSVRSKSSRNASHPVLVTFKWLGETDKPTVGYDPLRVGRS